MKQALILEGWFNHPNNNWYPWLKRELEGKGYKVYVPDLPTMDTDFPDMAKQIAFIESLLEIDEDIIIIGHSLGSLLAMRLAEKHKYKKMFLIAGWDFNDLTEGHKLFWKTPINHKKIRSNVKEIYCISSDNDLYMTAITVEDMSKRLSGKFILIKGAGHFTEKCGITKIPELLKYI